MDNMTVVLVLIGPLRLTVMLIVPAFSGYRTAFEVSLTEETPPSTIDIVAIITKQQTKDYSLLTC